MTILNKERTLISNSTSSLPDPWRIYNPKLRRHSCQARGKASPLDYILLSEHFLNNINTCSINPGLHSDHSIISVEIGENLTARGKGFWKVNSSLLHEKDYVYDIKKVIKTTESEIKNHTDKGLIWEIVKLKVTIWKELEDTLKDLESEL